MAVFITEFARTASEDEGHVAAADNANIRSIGFRKMPTWDSGLSYSTFISNPFLVLSFFSSSTTSTPFLYEALVFSGITSPGNGISL